MYHAIVRGREASDTVYIILQYSSSVLLSLSAVTRSTIRDRACANVFSGTVAARSSHEAPECFAPLSLRFYAFLHQETFFLKPRFFSLFLKRVRTLYTIVCCASFCCFLLKVYCITSNGQSL